MSRTARSEVIQDARRRLAADGPRHPRSPGDFELVSVPESDADALRDLLIAEEGSSVIEIGLAYGSSALAIAEALVSVGSRDARHVIVDPYQSQFRRQGWDALVEAGLADMCILIEERSQIVLPRLVNDGLVVDSAFVDGSHVFHNVFVDLFYLRELVRPGGLIVMDDCSYPAVATAVNYFEVNTGWAPERMSGTGRLRAFRTSEPREEPSFKTFRPFGLETAEGPDE